MKKLLLITLALMLYVSASAQKKIDGFLGIKFGSTKETVLATMKSKGAILDLKETTKDILQFKNAKLGVRTIDIFYVRFVDNKAFEADFLFLAPFESKTIDFYDKLVSDVNDVYGSGRSFKNFKKPYEDGDGYEITAIKTGNADYTTYWPYENSDDGNSISATITPPLGIRLRYQDSKLIQIAIDKQKAENKSDF